MNDIKDIKKIIPNSPIEKEIHSIQGSINNNNFDLPLCKSSLKTEIFDFVDQSELFVGKPVKLDGTRLLKLSIIYNFIKHYLI